MENRGRTMEEKKKTGSWSEVRVIQFEKKVGRLVGPGALKEAPSREKKLNQNLLVVGGGGLKGGGGGLWEAQRTLASNLSKRQKKKETREEN